MLQNYLKVAIRNLRRHAVHTTVAVSGLAVGLAAFILISLLVVDELSFDRFHENSDRIYRVVEVRSSPDLTETLAAYSAGSLADAATNDVPEVTGATRLIGAPTTGRRTAEHGERRFYESEYFITDGSVFDVFDFEFVAGNAETALTRPDAVVLTESGAAKYFGPEDPMGRTLSMEQFGDLEVTGVLADPPTNSHLQFKVLVSYATMNANQNWIDWLESWDNTGFLVYLELTPSADPETVSGKIADLLSAKRDNAELTRTPFLQPLTDIHFGSREIQVEYNAREGNPAYVYVLLAIGMFLVLVGAINYMNLATARSMRRAREVGLRKVVGCHRTQLIGQFLMESVLATIFAVVVAIGVVGLILPAFESFLNRDLSLGTLVTPLNAVGLLVVTILVGVISGSYPALYLARFRPIEVLAGSRDPGRGTALMRKVLVVTQFAVSIVMIVATSVVYLQLQYVNERELGFNEERLIVVDINNGDVRRDWMTVRAAFEEVPGVESVSTTSRVPGDWKDLTEIDVRVPTSTGSHLATMSYIAIDDAFFETFQIDLVAGRPLSDAFGSDSSAVIINETAARMLGVSEPDGSILSVPAEEFEGRIVGIASDFHIKSLHEEIGPLVLGYWNNPIRVIDYFTARVRGDDLAAIIAGLRKVGERFDPSHPFEYNILDQRLDDFYEADQRMGTLFGLAAMLAILIACLGLAGLASYTAEQRTKEIGVRKVLGASVRGIVLLMSKEFVVLVAIAFVVATPIAYLVMDRWLEEFAFRTDLTVELFIAAGLATLVIALATVSYQAIRSALANPVEALRYE